MGDYTAESILAAFSEGSLGAMNTGIEKASKAIKSMTSNLSGFDSLNSVINTVTDSLKETVKQFEQLTSKASTMDLAGSSSKEVESFQDLIGKISEVTSAVNNGIQGAGFGETMAGFDDVLTTYSTVVEIQDKIAGLGTAYQAWTKATEGATIAQKLLTTAMNANWIAIIITAVVTLVSTLIYLWNTNETFRQAIITAWTAIQSFLEPVITTITTFVQTMFAMLLTWWQTNQETIMNVVSTVWTSIQNIFTVVLAAIQLVVQVVLSQIQAYWTAWSTVVQVIVQAAWAIISNVFKTVLSVILSVVSGVFNQIQNTIHFIMGFISGIIQTVLALIKGDWDGVLAGIQSIVRTFGDFVTSSFSTFMATAKEIVNGIIGGIRDLFGSLSEIDLLEAGKAIIDGFINGLKAAWEAGKEFVTGIADWIVKHKGPVSYDSKILIPAGQAMMSGLNQGLTNGFYTVQKNIGTMADHLADGFQPVRDLDLEATLTRANGQMNTQVEHRINSTGSAKPAVFTITLGKQNFRAFVDDISQALGEGTELNLEF